VAFSGSVDAYRALRIPSAAQGRSFHEGLFAERRLKGARSKPAFLVACDQALKENKLPDSRRISTRRESLSQPLRLRMGNPPVISMNIVLNRVPSAGNDQL
jgi:hypothetical protein